MRILFLMVFLVGCNTKYSTSNKSAQEVFFRCLNITVPASVASVQVDDGRSFLIDNESSVEIDADIEGIVRACGDQARYMRTVICIKGCKGSNINLTEY